MPLAAVFGDFFEMPIMRKHARCSFCTPTRYAGITICTVADNSQVVGYRFRLDPEFRLHSCLVPGDLATPVKLYDSRSFHALSQIFVRSADENSLDAIVLRSLCGRRS